MVEPRLEGVFHVSETSGGGDYILGSVVRLEGPGKILKT